MKPPRIFSPINTREPKSKFSFQFLFNTKLKRRQSYLARFGVLLILLAIAISSAFYSSSSASSGKGIVGNAHEPLVGQGSGPVESLFPSLKPFYPRALVPPQAAPGPETITLYDATCTTPKTEFAFGEVVCAKVTNIPSGISRRIIWVDPNGFVERATPVIADGQTDVWTNPTTAQGLIADFFVIENRGTWRASIATSRGSVVATAFYTLKDPSTASSDLSINITALGTDNPVAGGPVQFLVRVANQGPDAATNVHFKDDEFFNATLDSVTQTGGSAFNCTDTGTVDCSIASLPSGATAEFVLNFTAGPAGSVINNEVSISSDTAELNEADNEFSSQPLRIVTGGPPPSCILECPNNVTVTANVTQNDTLGAIVTYPGAEPIGTCGAVNFSIPSGSFFPVGSTIVTSTSTQGSGSCSFTVNVIDSPPPTIACPANKSVTAADDACSASVEVGTPTATGTNVTVKGARNDGQLLDATYPGGTTTITWTAEDDSGRTATCTQTVTVTVNDTTPPTITAPPNLNLVTGATEAASCGVIVSQTQLTATADDNCSVSISSTGIPAGNFFPLGTTTVTYTATDSAGNTTTATQTVTVSDDTPPLVKLNGDDPNTDEFDAPTEATVECGSSYAGPGATAVDSCSGPVPVTASSFSTGTPGTYTIVYSATDGTNVGTATFTVHVVDTTAPTIALNGPNPVQVECHSPFVDPGATANDGCAGDFAATASGTVDVNTPGSYTITYNATDPSGNAATPVTRTVNVVDTLAPVITLNGANPYTVECHTSFTDPGATANDACTGPVSVGSSGSVDVDTPGTYTITYTATDGVRSSTATRTVTVVDTTPPAISCPANIVVTLPLNSSATSMAVSYPAVTATDSCASNVAVTTSQASGSVFPVGTTTVNATATDPSGNQSSCSFTVTVLYNFTGFFQPVANLPVLNVVNAGRAIPVKFSLSGNKGLNIFAPNYPASGLISCDTTSPAVDLEGTVTAGNSSLSYDAASDQYIYIWKTDSAWAGTCRQLVVQLNDGSLHYVNFKFK